MKAFIAVYFLLPVSCSLAQGSIYVQRGTDMLPFNTVEEMAPNLFAGDKVYFSSGSFNVGNWTINQNISVFGTGHYNQSNSSAYTLLTGSIKVGGEINGTLLSGFRLQGDLTLGTIAGFESIQDLTIERIAVFGNFETSYSGGDIVSGVSIRECIVNGFMHFGWENSHCSNSIMGTVSYNYPVPFNNSFSNCITVNGSGVSTNSFSNTTVSNCYFRYHINSDVNCTFTNNLFFSSSSIAGGDDIDFGTITNVGEANVFVGQSTIAGFDYSKNYQLQPTCPGVSYGADGTDIGIYGGQFPWKENMLPRNPIITNAIVSGATQENGSLPVQITIEAQEN